jgi:hypothetical protein
MMHAAIRAAAPKWERPRRSGITAGFVWNTVFA